MMGPELFWDLFRFVFLGFLDFVEMSVFWGVVFGFFPGFSVELAGAIFVGSAGWDGLELVWFAGGVGGGWWRVLWVC